MAEMRPREVNTFQNRSEEESYELLKNLDDTYMVIYEPSIGLQKKRTPDFILLSQKYGLIVLDVKYVKLSNIKASNPQQITKISGEKITNFHQTVKNYAYSVNNQLVNEFKEDATIVHSISSKMAGKLKFPHSSGLLLFIDDEDRYTKEDVSKILSLQETDFLIVNKIQSIQNELSEFIINLNRPFVKGLTSLMQGEILKKVYIDSDASATDFINTMSRFNLPINKNFKEILEGTPFEKSKQLKKNLLLYTTFSQNSIELANKNLSLGCENIIEKLKSYKQELEEEKFTVAVFGYFSTGKSTFLNTLMGTNKLPMEEDRSTATFTRLRHCDEHEDFIDGDMQVIYKDEIDISISYKESINKLNLSELDEKKYQNYSELTSFKNELSKKLKEIKIRDFDSSQRDDIKNSKKTLGFIIDNNIPYGTSDKVAQKDINTFLTDDKKAFGISEVIYYLNNSLLKDIEIVDTPGYGSENTMDTFKTQNFVKNANVLILLTEARDPMSKEDEHKFLETYENIYKAEDGSVNTDNLFIIANKVDESTKAVQKIKDSIVNKIEDNWEDSLVLKNDQIFTMSAKYHYDNIHSGGSDIVSENIDKNDLIDFEKNYSTFLTMNRDQEIIKNSFKNIDDSISEISHVFNKVTAEIEKDITNIQNKITKFENNKQEILETYEIFPGIINGMINTLREHIIDNLDNQILHSMSKTEEAFIRFLKNKSKSKNDASRSLAKEFYSDLSIAIFKELSQRNNSKFTDKLKKEVVTINRLTDKYSQAIETEYGITGLEKQISPPIISSYKIGNVDFDKGVINSILDVLSFGVYVDARDYAEKMFKRWQDNTYSTLLYEINDSNQKSIQNIVEDFGVQNNVIVDSIGAKLVDVKNSIIKRQKDREAYNHKIEKMKSTFIKISNFKGKIKKQETDLYS
mgnify:CR=1 FL=1